MSAEGDRPYVTETLSQFENDPKLMMRAAGYLFISGDPRVLDFSLSLAKRACQINLVRNPHHPSENQNSRFRQVVRSNSEMLHALELFENNLKDDPSLLNFPNYDNPQMKGFRQYITNLFKAQMIDSYYFGEYLKKIK